MPRHALGLAALLSLAAPTLADTAFSGFITREGDRLIEDGEPFRFVSWNIPNLLVLEDSFEFLEPSPWRWPDEYEVNDALETVRQMGGRVARTYVITVRREGSDMGDHVHVLGPGEFNERAFETLDMVLKVANEKGVRLIVPLVDNWKWMGGVDQYAAFRGKEGKEFWTDRQLIEDFKLTIDHVLNRRNSLTGVLYREDPAILCWETGNELDSPPEWLAEIAAHIKSIDPNHLLLDGRSLKGFPEAGLADPNVDLISTHHYPNSGNNDAASIVRNARRARGKKPYFVGEFGFAPIDTAQAMINAAIDEGTCGALYWSLRFRRREGGFYWHHEPSGGDLFKAYHWPGFNEGREYREHLVMPMIRQAAYRIRGMEAPPVDPPAAPLLLPIDSPAAISWQGATGASEHRVERADSPEGPWGVLASGLSDASVQYRPLFADSTAEPGRAYYYRVISSNQGGESGPSNLVGPVVTKHRVLVDELSDRKHLHETSGEVDLKTDEARKVQEDIHRLALAPGASVTYRLDGALSRARLFLYLEGSVEEGSLPEIFGLGDDGRTQELEHSHHSPTRSGGDYGYYRPILFDVVPASPSVRALRITLPESAKASAQLSRVEIFYSGAD